jgi:hypothetical protein
MKLLNDAVMDQHSPIFAATELATNILVESTHDMRSSAEGSVTNLLCSKPELWPSRSRLRLTSMNRRLSQLSVVTVSSWPWQPL